MSIWHSRSGGDHDPVAERDFLIQMFTLTETVSVCKHYLAINYRILIVFGGTFRTTAWNVEDQDVYLPVSKREFHSADLVASKDCREGSRMVAWWSFGNLPRGRRARLKQGFKYSVIDTLCYV